MNPVYIRSLVASTRRRKINKSQARVTKSNNKINRIIKQTKQIDKKIERAI